MFLFMQGRLDIFHRCFVSLKSILLAEVVEQLAFATSLVEISVVSIVNPARGVLALVP